jgi:hypothetical protein
MLIVKDGRGCQDTMRKQNYVIIDGPAGDYKVDTTAFCTPQWVTFTPEIDKEPDNASDYTVDSLFWLYDGANIGDLKIKSSVALPVRHTYDKAGMYLPIMQMVKWVTDSTTGQRERCVVTLQKDTIWAIDLKPDFITENLYGLNEPVAFVNATEALPTELKCADSVHWNYGNGNELWLLKGETLNKDGATIYNAEGIYTVTLTEYYKTCHQSISRNIEVVKDLGIKQLQVTSYKLQVYPNPAKNELQVTSYELQENEAYIQIYSVVGQMVYQISNLPNQQQISKSTNNQINNIIIDISHLGRGMYFLKVGNRVARFVKE